MTAISILLQHLNNQFLLISMMKFLINNNSHIELEDFQAVLEKKLAPMEKTHGGYLEFINLKKLNNLFYVSQKKVKKSSKE